MLKNTFIETCFISLILSLMSLGCGSDSHSSQNTEIDAPIIESKLFRGMVFAALSIDQSAGNSNIFRYDFQKGKIKKILVGESANPALFSNGAQVLLVNRHTQLKTYKIFDPFADEISPKTSDHNLVTGDPFDAISLDSNTFLLANPFGQSLQTVNIKTGIFQSIKSSKSYVSKVLRPIKLIKHLSSISIIHSGLELSSDGFGSADDSQQVYSALIKGDTLELTDIEPSTPVLDGSPLTATFPTFVSIKSGEEWSILGLCTKAIVNCKAGIDLVHQGKAKKIASFSTSAAGYLGQIHPSGTEGQAWGVVTNNQDFYVLALFNTLTGSILEESYRFSSRRLFGLSFEPESKTLIFGDTDGENGTLYLFRNRQKVASITIDGVFYRGVLIQSI